MIGLILSLIIIFAVHFTVYAILINLGVPYLYVLLITDLVLAFLFSMFNYRGYKKEAIKDPKFHRNVAIWFGILVLLDFLSLLV